MSVIPGTIEPVACHGEPIDRQQPLATEKATAFKNEEQTAFLVDEHAPDGSDLVARRVEHVPALELRDGKSGWHSSCRRRRGRGDVAGRAQHLVARQIDETNSRSAFSQAEDHLRITHAFELHQRFGALDGDVGFATRLERHDGVPGDEVEHWLIGLQYLHVRLRDVHFHLRLRNGYIDFGRGQADDDFRLFELDSDDRWRLTNGDHRPRLAHVHLGCRLVNRHFGCRLLPVNGERGPLDPDLGRGVLHVNAGIVAALIAPDIDHGVGIEAAQVTFGEHGQ